jgi:hypothetical protein
MADGSTKPIENVKVGDKVLSTDPETGKTQAQPVLATITGTDTKHLIQITVTTPHHKGKKSGVVIATDNHPFWTEHPGQWTQAGQLKPGIWLRISAGTYVQITAIKTWTQHQTVHNLTINQLHTYYVQAGATPVLVHNCGGAVQGHPARCNCAAGDAPKVRNGKLAGQNHPVTGVPFDENGFPDFSAWRHPDVPDVRIDLSGNRPTDFARANRAAGLEETPENYTWHHNQDKGLMQLVDEWVHAKTGHTGGFSG